MASLRSRELLAFISKEQKLTAADNNAFDRSGFLPLAGFSEKKHSIIFTTVVIV